MIIESLLSVLCTLSFGIMFNIGRKNLLFASLGGGISWFMYRLLSSYNLSLYTVFFISAIVFSIYSEICARIFKSPVTTFIICALIPLVPGSGMYYTMHEAIKGNFDASINMLMSTISSAGCLALGILFVSTVTRIISRKRIVINNK